MAQRGSKSPLYRKVNTRARGVHHDFGGDYRNDRRSKSADGVETPRGSMRGKAQRGLDYTPLFKFLLSKVGEVWDDVHSEAVSRLDRSEPIHWLVARNEIEQQEYVRVGESSYYSGLYVDDDGRLQKVNAALVAEDLDRQCTCCTHTFNGIRF